MNALHQLGELRGRMLFDEPMSRHTSWRVGGPADRFYQPADLQDLLALLQQLPEDEPLYWVGLGSNLLVRDAGVRGTVIATSGMLKQLTVSDQAQVRVEAGVACAKTARFSVEQGFSGAEFLAGIPGTMGGALAMNAGAFGGETWNIVARVETVDHAGVLHMRDKAEFDIDYRHVQMPAKEWFVAAHLALPQGDIRQGKARIKELLSKRGATQPTQIPNAGSVFKNPPQDYSARLIEASGLKGVCIGKACVSEMHSNFIVNTGGASAADIEALINRVQHEVEKKQGVKLEPEVRTIGAAL